MDLHRELSSDEKESFKKWARKNWKIDEKVNPIWHPVVVNECAVMLDEEIRKSTYKYDAGTLDWNFAYKDRTIGLDSSTDEISEEEQLEMAIEHFWEVEWEELINGEN